MSATLIVLSPVLTICSMRLMRSPSGIVTRPPISEVGETISATALAADIPSRSW